MQASKSNKDRRRFSFASLTNWFQRGRPGAATGGLYAKSDYGVWAETINPLRGLTAARAQDIFDRARRGIYSELTWVYQEIEHADPTLFVCAERRESATGACDWRVALRNPERTPGFEESMAQEQQEYLSLAFGAAGDEIGALAEHMARGFFRGFAHARPVYGAESVDGFEFFDQWNFARDPSTGQWWWNPDATYCANDNFQEIPEGELISLERSRHIDYPAILVYIRAALGEKKWGVFLERYGIPPVTVIMPEFADKTEESAYMEAAEKLAKAGSGALPFGSQVSYATEARGANPFTEFLRHQQELTVLLATGGLLTTLTAPGSGTLAGEAHLDTWHEVVSRDIRAVGRAVNRCITPRLLARRFPGRPALAMFEFSVEAAPTASEVFDHAAKAKAGGYLIERSDLEERTGYSLVKDESSPLQGFQPPLLANKEGAAPATPLQTPLQAIAKREEAPAPHKDTPEADPALEAILEAFRADLGPAAEKAAALLAMPPERRASAAAALAAELPSLMPGDPEAAAALEEALAGTFAAELEKGKEA